MATCDTNEQIESDIKDYIRRRFGYPTVSVELNDAHLCDVLQEAKDWFSRFIDLGRVKEATLLTTTAQSQYTVAADVDKVVRVWFEYPQDPFSVAFAFADVEIQYPQSIEGGSYSSILQELQYRKQARRILTADQDWWFNETDRQLTVHPVPAEGMNVRYRYIASGFDWAQLSPYHVALIRRRAVAEAMFVLSQIRGKYSELPGSTGSITLNGADLLGEASSQLSQLDEEIRGIQTPLGFWAD